MTQPLIGITPSPSVDELQHGTFERHVITTNYIRAVLAAGGIPVVLPPQDGNDEALLDAIDGLLLTGGGDIEPDRYGAERGHPDIYGTDPLRDRFECALVAGALRRNMPVLGICRGIQLLNVALGGTLIQHVADQSGMIEHRQQVLGLGKEQICHEIRITQGSMLERMFGETQMEVNSFHHQGVKGLAPGLVPVAVSADGLVEAVEMPDKAFVLAVQWHPEIMFEHDPAQVEPFHALVMAAIERS